MKKLLLLIAIVTISLQSNAQEVTQTVSITPHFRIALGGGYSRRLAKTAESVPVQLKNYVNELKNGYHFDLQAGYFFNNKWSLGLKYNLFNASNSLTNVTGKDRMGNQRTGGIADDIQINFIGASTFSRHISASGKHMLLLGVALGYMGYKNESVLFDKFQITGSTIGAALDAGYDFRIAKNIYIGAQASFIGGVLNSVTYDFGSTKTTVKLEDDQKEGLTRLDLSAGIRFNF